MLEKIEKQKYIKGNSLKADEEFLNTRENGTVDEACCTFSSCSIF